MLHNTNAEQSVLGACMQSKNALYTVLEKVGEDDFYDEKHAEIFAAVKSLEKQGSPVDPVTVAAELERRNILDRVGGKEYVAFLLETVPSVYHAAKYADIVKEDAVKRRVIETAEAIAEEGKEGAERAEDLLDRAQQQLYDIARTGSGREMVSLSSAIEENMRQINELANRKGGVIGVPSGFGELDRMTSGFQKSDLIILAARPSMGKTAFSLCVARNAAMQGKKIAYFSLEMSRTQISQRLLSMESCVDANRLRTGQIGEDDWLRMSAVLDRLAQAEIMIDDTPDITVMGIKNKCRRMKTEKGLDLVIIDYLQLMSGDKRAESRQQEVSALSRSLKQLARELDCPVLVLSQLSRAVETRADHRPQLSDLRESGAIEQDADLVIFLYRDEVYDPETPTPGECEVHIGKQRNGPIGTINVMWQGRYTRFISKA